VKLEPHSPSWGYGGENTMMVDGVAFTLPAGARARVVRAGRAHIGYIEDGDRGVHAFVAAGELDMPADLQARVRARYFAGKPLHGEAQT